MTSTVANSTSKCSMASLVTEVLASSGTLGKDDLSTKLETLATKISSVKAEVYDAVYKKYVDFIPCLNSTVLLSQQYDSLVQNQEVLCVKIKKEMKAHINISSEEYEQLSKKLEITKLTITIIERILKIYELLDTSDVCLKTGSYAKTLSSLQEAKTLIDKAISDGDEELKLLQILLKTYRELKAKLDQEVSDAWNRYVKWSKIDVSSTEPSVNKLTIGNDICKPVQLTDLVFGLQALSLLDVKMQAFAKRLMNSVILPIIINKASVSCEVIALPGNVSKAEIAVSFSEELNSSLETTQCKRAIKIIDHICHLFKFLNTHLLAVSVIVKPEEMNVTLEEMNTSHKTLMEMLGNLVCDELINALIKDCLNPAVPSQNNEIESFKEVQSAVNYLQSLLVELQFLDGSNNKLCECISDVKALLAEKRSQELLVEARTLIVTENHNTVPVGEKNSKPAAVSDNTLSNTEHAAVQLLCPEIVLSSATFSFPQCQISWSTHQLVILAFDALNDGLASNHQYALQMFTTVRNIFELFCHVAPVINRNNMDNLPQAAALFHNDCMYIAHHLITLGHQFRVHLPSEVSVTTFVDLVPHLRRLATDSFLKQLRRQRSILIEYLKATHGFVGLCEDSALNSCKQAIEQTVHHLHHLSNVWRSVLPSSIFLKAIGTLTNAVIQEMTSNVLCLQDISSDEAAELHTLFSMFVTRVQECFALHSQAVNSQCSDESQTVARANLLKYARKVTMLEQLMAVLDASLQIIVDLWSNGKGSLANEFTADQIKHLIRALFQNTEKRANALAKIK